jgi:hypothetical protein
VEGAIGAVPVVQVVPKKVGAYKAAVGYKNIKHSPIARPGFEFPPVFAFLPGNRLFKAVLPPCSTRRVVPKSR